MEHDEQSDRLERDAEGLAQDSDEVGEHIEETRKDWEAKEKDRSVPGAQPADEEEIESVPGAETDEELLSEEGGP
ncbi:MAG TPA: hypothetical protein VEY90_07450 [Thermoleophilaceae bacterium]|jgi:hypothetical protein|nr:hypothetical protein [Thermoleophilaceae bacterium]